MSEEKKLDEETLEKVAGGVPYEEYVAAKEFRESFISANCSHCAKRGTEDCSYPDDNVADMLGMYYMFRYRPACPFIIAK